MTDLMDERLSAAARRWQAAQPAPPGVPLERLDSTGSRSTRSRQVRWWQGGWRQGGWRPVAAAVAAVLSGGVTVAVLRAGDRAPGGPSDTSSSPSQVQRAQQVVPWRDLKAQHPTIARREHGRTVTPFDNVMAGGDIQGHVHPGDVLTFTVFLESATDVSLDPCPDYMIAFGATGARSWQLNCAQVPYRQAKPRPKPGVVRLHASRWHPVLPAGRRVRFEMRVTVPEVRGRQKVLWTLVGPTTMPGFYGIVHVTAR